MSIKTDSELIRDETGINRNTATRVGGVLVDMATGLELLQDNQYSGVIVYETLLELPATGVDNTSYKVSNDTDTSLNGYYHWNGSSYIKDYSLANGKIKVGNVDATSGDTVYEGVKRGDYQTSDSGVEFLDNAPYSVDGRLEDSPFTSYTPTLASASEIAGLDFELTSISGVITFVDTGISWGDDIVRIDLIVDSLGTDVLIGLGFGDLQNDSKFSTYRETGQLIGSSTSTASVVLTNGYHVNRDANVLYEYVIGDTISIEINPVDKTVRTAVNGVYSPSIPVNEVPTGNIKIAIRGNSYDARNTRITQISVSKDEFYVDNLLGLDTNYGTASTPLKSINAAINKCLGKTHPYIYVKEGEYRETLDFSNLTYENLKIEASQNELVKVMGSDQLTGWVKTGGYSNIYQTAISDIPPDWTYSANKIFEYGNWSKPISYDDYNALQKGKAYRLFYTEIEEIPLDTNLGVTLTSLDATPSKYYNDSGVIYMHNTNSNNPETSPYRYENIVRNINTELSQGDVQAKKPNLSLKFINFYFGLEGLVVGGFNKVERFYCTAFGMKTSAGGFSDSGCNEIYAYRDEAAGCSNDGINGHMNFFDGIYTADDKVGVGQSVYIDSYCHDNDDDGMSHHERHEVTVQGGLFEYNGDSGIRAASSANYRVYNAISRFNGQLDLAGATYGGEGFANVNVIDDNRSYGSMEMFGCFSYENKVGFQLLSDALCKMTLHNCTSRNNERFEYRVNINGGKMILNNCLATNATPANIIQEDSGGIIEIYTDTIVS